MKLWSKKSQKNRWKILNGKDFCWSDPRWCKFTWREASYQVTSVSLAVSECHWLVAFVSSRVARSITPARSSICVSEAVSSFHHLARQCALTVWNRWHRLLCMMHGPQTGFTTVTINYKLHICEYSWQFDWKWISCKCCDVLESKLFPYGEESRESWMLYMGHPIILDLVLDSPAKSAIAILSVLFQIYLELKALEIAAKHLSQLDEMRDDLVSVALSLGDFGGWGSLLAFWDGNAWVT